MHRTTTIGLLILMIIIIMYAKCKKERLQLAQPSQLMWGGVRTSAHSVGSQVGSEVESGVGPDDRQLRYILMTSTDGNHEEWVDPAIFHMQKRESLACC